MVVGDINQMQFRKNFKILNHCCIIKTQYTNAKYSLYYENTVGYKLNYVPCKRLQEMYSELQM